MDGKDENGTAEKNSLGCGILTSDSMSENLSPYTCTQKIKSKTFLQYLPAPPWWYLVRIILCGAAKGVEPTFP